MLHFLFRKCPPFIEYKHSFKNFLFRTLGIVENKLLKADYHGALFKGISHSSLMQF